MTMKRLSAYATTVSTQARPVRPKEQRQFPRLRGSTETRARDMKGRTELRPVREARAVVELIRDEAAAEAHARGLEDHEPRDELPPAAELLGAEPAAGGGRAEQGERQGDEVGQGKDKRELLAVTVVARRGGQLRSRPSEALAASTQTRRLCASSGEVRRKHLDAPSYPPRVAEPKRLVLVVLASSARGTHRLLTFLGLPREPEHARPEPVSTSLSLLPATRGSAAVDAALREGAAVEHARLVGRRGALLEEAVVGRELDGGVLGRASRDPVRVCAGRAESGRGWEVEEP